MLKFHKTMPNLWVFCFPPTPWAKRGNSYRLNVWCTVRVESALRTSKKYFIDILMFPLFGKISWRKKWLSSVKLKTKSEELECVIFPVFQPPASQFLHRVYYDLWRLLHFKWKKKNPTLPVHHIYVLLDLQYMIVADIILSRVMIKHDYAVWEE